MKTHQFLIFVFVALPQVVLDAALGDEGSHFKVSATVNRVSVLFPHLGKQTNYSNGDLIQCLFFAHEPPLLRVYLPKPEYLLRFRLTDEHGGEVGLKTDGRRFGNRFDELKVWKPEQIQRTRRGNLRSFLVHHGKELSKLKEYSGESVDADGNPITIDKLFSIQRPGRYQLSIEFQFFVSAAEDPPGTLAEFKLTRLPMITIPVIVE